MRMSSLRSKTGFATVYFLGLFLFASTLISLITGNIQYRLKTLANLKEETRYLAAENNITRYLQCELANDRFEDTVLELDQQRFSVHFEDKRINVYVTGNVQETLIYEVENNRIYDYEVIR